MSPARQILVIQPKRIGDLILTAPALEFLRATFPDAELSLVVAGASGGVTPLIRCKKCYIYRYRRPNLKLWAKLATSRYDLCIDFGGTDRSAFMARLTRAPVRATYQKFVTGRRRARSYTLLSEASVRNLHTADFHLALAKETAEAVLDRDIPDPPPSESAGFGLEIPSEIADSTRRLLERHAIPAGTRYAIVHPGTARAEKYWSAAGWAEVIRHLDSLGLVPVITGADSAPERAHLDEIHALLGNSVPRLVDLAGKISLAELAGLIAGSDIAIGVDSAAMHFAAAFRRPQIVLFGPTNPYHWRPRHPAAGVILASSPDGPATEFTPRHKKAPMSQISTDAVTGAIDGLFQKSATD